MGKNRDFIQQNQSPFGDRAELNAGCQIPRVFAPLRPCVKLPIQRFEHRDDFQLQCLMQSAQLREFRLVPTPTWLAENLTITAAKLAAHARKPGFFRHPLRLKNLFLALSP